ncbi:MAG: UDP-N-acetylmuramoyl-L-alanine--D-glutamate ligase [Acidobacteriota bacterium]
MQAATDYNGKTALVVGAGRSGLAASDFLIGWGARVILTDSKDRGDLDEASIASIESTVKSGMLELELGGHRPGSFESCDFVVISPGVPLTLVEFDLCRKAGIPILTEVELAFRHLQGRIIGISGSNGKTTTTTLVAELLRQAGIKAYAAGNIGLPLTNFVDASTRDDIYVVELSSFQLEGITDFRPWIGSLLNVTPDHLDRYESFGQYAAAKSRMFLNQETTDYAVLNRDDALVAAMAVDMRSKPFWFSRMDAVRQGACVKDNRVVFCDRERETDLFPVSAIRLMGSHNLENTLAACTMAILAGAPPETLERGIRQFKGVEHRIEFVAEIDGVRYFNDSKATNVEAAVKSIESFGDSIVMIAGGRDKGADFSVLKDPLRKRGKYLVLIGEAAGAIRDALGNDVETSEAATIQEAVQLCGQHAEAGDVVLLAPACASFDMFRDYEHRGRVFKDAVRKLKQSSGKDIP